MSTFDINYDENSEFASLDVKPSDFNNPDLIEQINDFCSSHPELRTMYIAPSFSYNDYLRLLTGSNLQKKYGYYDRLMFEKTFYDNYDKIEYPEKLSLEIRKASAYSKSRQVSHFEYDYFPLNECVEMNKKIKLFTRDIKESELSPFEKSMALYVLATHFIDSYKSNGDQVAADKDSQSSCIYVLRDDETGYNIQCAGYTDLFCRMAAECGISTKTMQIDVAGGNGHEVAVVDIDDTKYGIYGSFICDVRNGSDFREIIDAMAHSRNNKRKAEGIRTYPYYSYIDLTNFCLSCSDYDTYFRENTGLQASSIKYEIDTNFVDGDMSNIISDERISVYNMAQALGQVYGFIDESNGRDDGVEDVTDFSIHLLETVRKTIDEGKAKEKENTEKNRAV